MGKNNVKKTKKIEGKREKSMLLTFDSLVLQTITAHRPGRKEAKRTCQERRGGSFWVRVLDPEKKRP